MSSGRRDLLFDIGNTRVKWGIAIDGEIRRTGTISHERLREQGYSALTTRLPTKVDAVLASNVAGQTFATRLSGVIGMHCNTDVHFARSAAEGFGVTNSYRQPRKLGVDRWVAMIGARAFSRKALCIVDAGTAVTIDALDSSGQHLGGQILPGIHLMNNALAEDTSDLPAVKRAASNKLDSLPGFASSTSKAIYSGAMGAVCGADRTRDARNAQRRLPAVAYLDRRRRVTHSAGTRRRGRAPPAPGPRGPRDHQQRQAMRNLLLLLLLANVLYYFYGLYNPPTEQNGVAIVSENDLGPPLQLADATAPERVEGADPEAVTSRPTELEVQTGRSCVSIGPFREQEEAQGALADFEEAGLRGALRTTEGEVFVGHWVQIRGIPDRATANSMLTSLKADRYERGLYRADRGRGHQDFARPVQRFEPRGTHGAAGEIDRTARRDLAPHARAGRGLRRSRPAARPRRRQHDRAIWRGPRAAT